MAQTHVVGPPETRHRWRGWLIGIGAFIAFAVLVGVVACTIW